tara:strand:- start:997 stop:1380 length:384 start_codon:yes stop_codon:yes gene_type:complete
MTVTAGTVADALAGTLITDAVANNTSETDVFGGGSTVYAVEIDNTANTGQVQYLKIWDATSGAASGVKAMSVFYAPAGEKVSYICDTGTVYSSGVTFWVTQTQASYDGSTEAQAAPSNSVIAKILGT